MREQRLDRRREIIGDGAAQTAVGQFDDIFVGAIIDAAGAQNLAVDPDIAKFIDHQREAAVSRGLQQMTDQRGLAGAEKAGDDGGGDF